MMAGMAIISSDLPGIAGVLKTAGGGITFRSGDPNDLRCKILDLHRDLAQLQRFAKSSRDFALRQGNLEKQIETFLEAITPLVQS